ncbi:DUF2256 domain-containing protein, partial [Catenovulum maritimum]
MPHKKLHLDSKICPICQLSFSWRKKWERKWNDIIYCSQKCRKNKHEKQH